MHITVNRKFGFINFELYDLDNDSVRNCYPYLQRFF